MHNTYNRETGALWKDENFDIASYRATGATPPDVVNVSSSTVKTVSFTGAATLQEVNVCKELNHDYQEGTDISFHVHWYPTTTGAGNVKWQIEYWAQNFGIIGTTVSGLISSIQAASGTAWQQQTASFGLISLGALAKIGTQIHFRFFRNPVDGQDTYADPAAVATVGWHYKTDARGSSQMTAKQ